MFAFSGLISVWMMSLTTTLASASRANTFAAMPGTLGMPIKLIFAMSFWIVAPDTNTPSI